MEQEFTFEDNHHSNKQKGSVLKFLWNSDTKEFLGRDGGSWAKVSLFYAVFYTCLGSFFVGMLAVFMYQMPRDKPTYFGKSSTMSQRGLNPGLGFRPQIDVEDHLIYYNPNVNDNPSNGYSKYVRNLKNFLDAKYKATDDSSSFNYEKAFEDTDCTYEKNFGFDKPGKACVLLKLNKIISWAPAGTNVTIICQGEFSADKDNLRGATYYSPDKTVSDKSGSLDKKYFPYENQPTYRAPFVFAQFDIPANTLVNIECRAYDLDNIDNTDRLNRRGMTKFSLYVETPNVSN